MKTGLAPKQAPVSAADQEDDVLLSLSGLVPSQEGEGRKRGKEKGKEVSGKAEQRPRCQWMESIHDAFDFLSSLISYSEVIDTAANERTRIRGREIESRQKEKKGMPSLVLLGPFEILLVLGVFCLVLRRVRRQGPRGKRRGKTRAKTTMK